MKGRFPALPMLAALLAVALAAPRAGGAETKPAGGGKRYRCAPCGMGCDENAYDRPGSCPHCAEKLVEEDEATETARNRDRKKVAILIYDGVRIIDSTGPYEIFMAAGFDVYTVAATKESINTVAGMTVTPRYSFADAPAPDVLVVPGGGLNGVHESEPTLKWVAATAAAASHTMSISNGAFILAQVDLLDGLKATTTYSSVAKLKAMHPKIEAVDDQRFVESGKILTTAGPSAGIDGALHIVEEMLGLGRAQEIALGEEYDWNTGFARGKLADRLIGPSLRAVAQATGKWDLQRTEGDMDRWTVVMNGASSLSPAEILAKIDQVLTAHSGWTRAAATTPASTGEAVRGDWTFSGPSGTPWRGTAAIDAAKPRTGDDAGGDAPAHRYTITLSVAKGT